MNTVSTLKINEDYWMLWCTIALQALQDGTSSHGTGGLPYTCPTRCLKNVYRACARG